MNLKTQAIVLKTTKYNDQSLIIKLFTKEFGLKSYIVSIGKKTNTKATFQALNMIEIETSQKGNNQMARIKNSKVYFHYKTIPTSIYKTTVLQFLQELLYAVIKEESANIDLYEFIEVHLQYFDECMDFNPNYHLYFTIELTKYFGFYPQGKYAKGKTFNIEEGQFDWSHKSAEQIDSNLSENLYLLTESNIENNKRIKLSVKDRRNLLNELIVYYQYHLDGFKELKSIPILESLFSD